MRWSGVQRKSYTSSFGANDDSLLCKRSYDNVGIAFVYDTAPLKKWKQTGHLIAREYLRGKKKISLSNLIEKYTADWDDKEKRRFRAWLKAEMETRYGGVSMLKSTTAQKVERLLVPDVSVTKQDLYRRISLFRRSLSKLEADGLIRSESFAKINGILNQLEDEIAQLQVRAIIDGRVKCAVTRIQRFGVEARQLNADEGFGESSDLREAVDSVMRVIGFLERHSVENSLSRIAAILQKHNIATQELWDKIGEFTKAAKSITNALEELVSDISQVHGSELLSRREVA